MKKILETLRQYRGDILIDAMENGHFPWLQDVDEAIAGAIELADLKEKHQICIAGWSDLCKLKGKKIAELEAEILSLKSKTGGG